MRSTKLLTLAAGAGLATAFIAASSAQANPAASTNAPVTAAVTGTSPAGGGDEQGDVQTGQSGTDESGDVPTGQTGTDESDDVQTGQTGTDQSGTSQNN
ncbi:MAG: hypothetical protein DLM58_22950 [Pseudonocardiales bacterium]|nr:MAG: hypothetical protein DLM58_22950 [Pseudonocardiales bacterium]